MIGSTKVALSSRSNLKSFLLGRSAILALLATYSLALSLLVFRVHGKYLNLLSRRGEANISQMSPPKMKKIAGTRKRVPGKK